MSRTPAGGRFRRRLFVLASVVAVGVAPAVATAGPAEDAGSASGRVALPNPVPTWPVDYIDNGVAPPSVALTFRMYLTGRVPRAEVRFATEVSTPGSRQFRHYLTPRQFQSRFGPSRQQISAVSHWARAHELTVTAINGHYLRLRGTAPAISKALDTSIDDYGGTLARPLGYAPVKGISVPATIAPDVLTAVGLDNYIYGGASDSPDAPTPPARAARSIACSSWWGQHHGAIPKAYGRNSAPTENCGYTPNQLRAAYGIRKFTGKGATVAIVLDGHLSTMRSDANRFFAAHHVAGFAKRQFTQNFGPGFARSCGSSADLPEEPLDVETVHIIAPAAKVIYVAVNCGGGITQPEVNFLDAETRIVDSHLADVETESFSTLEAGYTPSMVAAWTKIFQQGAAEGIGFNFDSGDGGDDTNNDPSTPPVILFPASDPWATAVGGTALEIGRTGRVLGELGWGDTIAVENQAHTGYLQKPPGSFNEGSTGGRSELFGQPAYQRGVVPRSLATADGTQPAARVGPDIAADADALTGWLIAYTQDAHYEQIIEGGTSGSSPIIASLEADAKQASGHAVGFANPTLYALRHSPGIRDIVPSKRPVALLAPPSDCVGNTGPTGQRCLITLGLDSSLRETRGFDDVTGLGAATAKFIGAVASP